MQRHVRAGREERDQGPRRADRGRGPPRSRSLARSLIVRYVASRVRGANSGGHVEPLVAAELRRPPREAEG